MPKLFSILKVLLIFMIIQGCTPMSKITYLNDSQLGEWDVSPVPPKHHLEIGDILMVKVISRNEESNDLFNIENNTKSASPTLTAANLYLNGFTISQEGTIDIPNVGEIFVLNQTLEEAEETILPNVSPDKQYEFATSFLKVGDYPTAERACREFVLSNPDHQLAGNAQYWYAETFRIRQLYTDAASAYLEGYQKYPKGEKAPVNLLKLGVSMVQIGEKDQGCKMINGVEKQYPDANQSVIQKAKYESQKFECNQNS